MILSQNTKDFAQSFTFLCFTVSALCKHYRHIDQSILGEIQGSLMYGPHQYVFVGKRIHVDTSKCIESAKTHQQRI